MEGPYSKINIVEKLNFLNNYDKSVCKIYYGTRPLTNFQQKLEYIEPLLNMGHWFLFLDFGGKNTLLVESSKLGRLKGITPEEVSKVLSSNGQYYFRKSEGIEILCHNQLIRIKKNHTIDEQTLTLVSRNLFRSKTMINFCIKYLEFPYNYVNRNCQSFVRKLSYELGDIDYASMLNLNLDGSTYIVLLIVVIIIGFCFFRR